MNVTYFLLLVVPIVAFVAVDAFAGLRAGILSAMILGVGVFAANLYISSIFEWTSLIEPALILALGGITLRFKDPKYFKFQPAITNSIMAIVLAYYQTFDTPFLQKYIPLFAHTVPPEARAHFENPLFILAMAPLSLHLIFLLVFHGALVTWVAIKLNNWWWLMARLAGYPLMFGLMIYDLMPFFRSVQP